MAMQFKIDKERLLERFITYAKICTTSNQLNADKGIQPSFEGESELANLLKDELVNLGVKDCTITKYGYVCARIPASAGYESAPPICFLAHLDTSDAVSGKNVMPQIWQNYDGKAINLKDGVVLDPLVEKTLAKCAGNTIITSDGTTLLGADDKAGIAEIMCAIEFIIKNNVPHGVIEIIFSPDEETGHGMDNVPLDWISAHACYTLDGSNLGEVETECFNAYKAVVKFTGKAKHTGTARPDMVNSITMANTFLALLPRNESPEATDGYLGFYAPMDIQGTMEETVLTIFLRDFDADNMQKRIQNLNTFARAVEAGFDGGKVTLDAKAQYKNMKNVIQKTPLVVDLLVKALKQCNIEPVFSPIRGGTDGSRLCELGLPTPNIFTGGHNFHSRSEWASLEQMAKACQVVITLASLWKDAE